ncbi:MAG TPA: hypothetical protein VGR96_07160, partial [Acidobacteriaceae bacterium]|nr:hypothetical protein [Acidobacteriaceae bacterium]
MSDGKPSQLLVLFAIAVLAASPLGAAVRKPPAHSSLSGAGAAPDQNTIIPRIERMSPALKQIIPPHPILQKVATGFTWTEGPVWIPSGYLLFAEIPSNSIRRWVPGQ